MPPLSAPRHTACEVAVPLSPALGIELAAAFRSLAVFVGGFDTDAACAVASRMSLDVLARLVEQVADHGGSPLGRVERSRRTDHLGQ